MLEYQHIKTVNNPCWKNNSYPEVVPHQACSFGKQALATLLNSHPHPPRSPDQSESPSASEENHGKRCGLDSHDRSVAFDNADDDF